MTEATPLWRRVLRAPGAAVIWVFELYRTYVSPMRPPTCRYIPTCSEYGVTAVREWGVVRGLALATWRLLRCAPWGRGGWDPVPQRRSDSETQEPEATTEVA